MSHYENSNDQQPEKSDSCQLKRKGKKNRQFEINDNSCVSDYLETGSIAAGAGGLSLWVEYLVLKSAFSAR
ncbi:hypothetical protein [Bacillus swezeyi]|uniref:hypothetical protein n=1 Tax=Bacillus swezeyi TaxID=1925020 RepID=UPI003F8BB190